jgi:hypothetical protein
MKKTIRRRQEWKDAAATTRCGYDQAGKNNYEYWIEHLKKAAVAHSNGRLFRIN